MSTVDLKDVKKQQHLIRLPALATFFHVLARQQHIYWFQPPPLESKLSGSVSPSHQTPQRCGPTRWHQKLSTDGWDRAQWRCLSQTMSVPMATFTCWLSVDSNGTGSPFSKIKSKLQTLRTGHWVSGQSAEADQTQHVGRKINYQTTDVSNKGACWMLWCSDFYIHFVIPWVRIRAELKHTVTYYILHTSIHVQIASCILVLCC